LERTEILPLKPRLSLPGAFVLLVCPEKIKFYLRSKKECVTMFRKILIILVMAPLIIAAASSDTSFPVLLMMISLFLIAVMESSNRDEQLD
jgi:hypothetical protein